MILKWSISFTSKFYHSILNFDFQQFLIIYADYSASTNSTLVPLYPAHAFTSSVLCVNSKNNQFSRVTPMKLSDIASILLKLIENSKKNETPCFSKYRICIEDFIDLIPKDIRNEKEFKMYEKRLLKEKSKGKKIQLESITITKGEDQDDLLYMNFTPVDLSLLEYHTC